MNSSKRERWIDVARGFSMLSIILMHCQPPKPIGQLLASYSVQLFFVLSGYLMSTKKTFQQFVVGKANRLLIPYAFLGFIIILFQSIKDYFLDHNGFPFITYFKDLLIQRSFTSLWFLTCLFLAFVWFYLILRISKGSIVFSGVICTIICIGSFIYYRRGGEVLPWNIDTSFVSLFFLSLR